VDLGGTIIGNTTLVGSNTGDDAKITGSGGLGRVRIDGGGETGDGKFGGYYRFEGGATGNAWWKPIDQFKLLIGGNGGDGFIGKEGVTGWSFYQTPYDTGVILGGNVWGWGPGYDIWDGTYKMKEDNSGPVLDKDGNPIKNKVEGSGSRNMYGQNIIFRDVFFGGDGGEDVYLFITPMDMLAVNVILPYFSKSDKKAEDIFKYAIAQIDLKLNFGNIALTYRGASGDLVDQPKIYLYFGGSFGDLSIDFGFSYQLAGKDPADNSYALPMGVGLGVKYATDSFGVKLRVAATLGGDDKLTKILADLQPYFSLGDNLSAFVSVGIGMTQNDSGDNVLGWHFNPYIVVGEEWGAKFVAGVKVWSPGELYGADSVTYWAIPIALIVSF